jgi:uncharacterized protein YciI
MYVIRPVRHDAFAEGFTEQENQRIGDHFKYLEKLTAKGTVLLAGKTPNIPGRGFGIVIFKTASQKTARQLVNNDPAVKNNVFRAELFPFSIALSKTMTE